MAPGRKLGTGCWTCRLRRKRCDSVRPTCRNCQSLEITCHSGEAKPLWMDGGVGQKDMSETIKEEIKQNALSRRERRLAHKEQHMTFATDKDHGFFTDAVNDAGFSHTNDNVEGYIPPSESDASIFATSHGKTTTHQPSPGQSEVFHFPFTTNSSTSGPITLPIEPSLGLSLRAGLAIPIQVELGAVMIYLDYVFPFLFPFYQPPLIETGRQWLLGLLCQNKVSFHIAASLSAYFFSLIPKDEDQAMHDDCKALVRDKLMEQMDMAFSSIQGTVSAIGCHGAQSPLLDKIRIMEEIIQFLIVEVTIRRNTTWTIHLTPALALFDEVFKSHGFDNLEPSLAVLLSALPSSSPTPTPHHKPLPNTADQSALMFFMSLLLFVDIIASTSLGTSPALQSFHHSILSSHSSEQLCIQLENVVGCQSWALVVIGNISTLCGWKREAKQSGNYSFLNLVELAGPISQALEEGLTSLDMSATHSRARRKMSAGWLEAYYARHDRNMDNASIANVTRIWAYAAKIYLSISLWGWETSSTDMQASVASVLYLLQTIESPAQLRSLSWPICVAGCLAVKSQENTFRCIISSMGQLGEFGTVLIALQIMEAVWASRATIDGDVWDLASSLSILGSSALLV